MTNNGLTVLSKLTIAELQKIGRDLKLEPLWPAQAGVDRQDPGGQAKESGMIYDEGVLEILPDGFGFLRSPNYNYLPAPMTSTSPHPKLRSLSPQRDTVAGYVRPPKEQERFFALLQVKSVNGSDLEMLRNARSLTT